jgi:prophage tail gpP-like protein
MTDDTVWLSIGGIKFGGWTAVRVTRGIELMPSSFSLSLTERYPDQPTKMDIKPGDQCIVQFGSDIVLSGWVDRIMPSIDTRGHHITILGRGRCCDLVDCSAYANNRQFINHSVLDIATAVCKPFGIVVSQRDPGTPPTKNEKLTADGQVIPLLSVNLTTTPWQIVEEMARYSSLLAYESETGDLLLAQVGTAKAASGFTEGVNVQSAASVVGIDQRYSTVWAVALAVDTILQTAQGAPPPAPGTVGGNIIASPSDPGVTRYRPLVIVSEQGYGAYEITERRALWEIARRYGRSQAITVFADSWRDGAGKLWSPNTLASLDIPALHIDGMDWLISEITFSLDIERGTIAEVTMMPPQAFTPRPPTSLFDGQLQRAMDESIASAQMPSVAPAHA